MADASEITVVEEVLGYVKVYSDGSIVRTDDPNLITPPSQEPSDENGGVLSKDVMLDSNVGLWVRLYLPPQRNNAQMPLLIFFHGGGFCKSSPAHINVHRFCLKWAASIGAIIVSVKYRLAPEHRLPAAYEDSIAALEWIHSQSMKKKENREGVDPWFDSHADFSNVYLGGSSAGGNIAHHLGMSWVSAQKNWQQLRMRGMILLQPAFAGEERSASEIKYCEGPILNLKFDDMVWRLALPVGSNKDHRFSNPFGPQSPSLTDATLPPMIVVIGGRDLLSSRHLEYCQALKKCGKQIRVLLFEEEDHGFIGRNLEGQSSLRVLECVCDFFKSVT
eukprot:Gb_31960 [translate_table: standard]